MYRPNAREENVAVTSESSESAETAGAMAAADPWVDRKASELATRAAQARQLSGRRRFVDPATCERDYGLEELEFMNAMQDYKKRSGRNFPTWSEVLEVLHSLGYRKDEIAAPAGP